MAQMSFGQVINVTGPGNGFPGAISRFAERVVAAKPFMPSNAALTLNFGDPAVVLQNNLGGYFDSVADFVAASPANIGLVASAFAGMAVREVKTQLVYPAGQQPGILQVGYYANEQIAEVLERGSGTIFLAAGSPLADQQVYTRVVLNVGAVPSGYIGDWETNPGATDLFSTTLEAAAAVGTAITLASATNVLNGQVVSGAGIQPGTYVVSGGGTVNIVLSQPLTMALAIGTPITFSNLVALPSVVARTGHLDMNGILEITIKNRVAA
jgi:hypothetical protein